MKKTFRVFLGVASAALAFHAPVRSAEDPVIATAKENVHRAADLLRQDARALADWQKQNWRAPRSCSGNVLSWANPPSGASAALYDCAPFKCSSDGYCRQECAGNQDCAPGARCVDQGPGGANGVCVGRSGGAIRNASATTRQTAARGGGPSTGSPHPTAAPLAGKPGPLSAADTQQLEVNRLKRELEDIKGMLAGITANVENAKKQPETYSCLDHARSMNARSGQIYSCKVNGFSSCQGRQKYSRVKNPCHPNEHINRCESTGDCLGGYVCDTNVGKCVAPPPPDLEGD